MSNLNQEQKLFLKQRTITDRTNIEKFDKEFNYKFFIPEHELAGIDTEMITKGTFIKSKGIMGERVPILVAVNPHDQYLKHPKFRIHGRVIDGKHKYLESKQANHHWATSYVFINSYEEFNEMWLHADIVKNENVANIQLKQRIKDYCELMWMQKPESIKDKDGKPQKDWIGQLVVKKFEGQRSVRRLYDYIPKEYINQKVSKSLRKRVVEKPKSKKDKEIYRLIQERDQLLKQNGELQIMSKPENEKDRIITQLERQIVKMGLSLSNVKSYLKQERQKSGSDETEKEFEIWWSKIVG
jgi:hypothetical protein